MLAGCVELADSEDPGHEGDPVLVEVDNGDGNGDPVIVGPSAIAPDPSGVILNGYCHQYRTTAAGTKGHIYWPPNGGCGASVWSPLVVVVNGVGFDRDSYNYLLEHLARNGYIGMAIEALPGATTAAAYQAASDAAWAYVDWFWDNHSIASFVDPSRVALVGHSRGGTTVRFMAEDHAADPLFDVRSVIELAPTSHQNVQLDGGNTQSALVLVGAWDEDPLPAAAYRIHDNAGSEASHLDPGANANAIWAAMKLIDETGHSSFGQAGDTANMTKGYALAFLQAHLKNDRTYYEDYIRGEELPAGGPKPATTQYRDRDQRRVIDNFEDNDIEVPTIAGGTISPATGSGDVVNLGVSTATPHDTYAVHYTPPANGGGFHWGLPVGKRDQSLYKYLSIRVGQIAGVPTDDLRVRITNSGVVSGWVRLTDHGTLAQPIGMCMTPTGIPNTLCGDIEDQNHMGTIRIPLSAFGAHDNVTHVTLASFAEAIDGEFYIDNVEFSEHIFGT
jgi:hypothetical protein